MRRVLRFTFRGLIGVVALVGVPPATARSGSALRGLPAASSLIRPHVQGRSRTGPPANVVRRQQLSRPASFSSVGVSNSGREESRRAGQAK